MALRKRLLVVPAAGKGSRLGALVPKPLVRINDRTLIERVLAAFPDHDYAIIVHSETQGLFARELEALAPRIQWFFQNEARGMADAIYKTISIWSKYETIAIAWADLVWMKAQTLTPLLQEFDDSSDAMQVPGFKSTSPYTGIETEKNMAIKRILESREGPVPMELPADLGVFFMKPRLVSVFESYMHDDTQGIGKSTGEKNFLPFMAYLYNHGEGARLKLLEQAIPFIGINTNDELEAFSKGEISL